jgi:hypothetical protein
MTRSDKIAMGVAAAGLIYNLVAAIVNSTRASARAVQPTQPWVDMSLISVKREYIAQIVARVLADLDEQLQAKADAVERFLA